MISRARLGCCSTSSPMQKKVALAECWSQQVEDQWSHRRVRAVVDCNRHRTVGRSGRGQMRPVGSQQLASRPKAPRPSGSGDRRQPRLPPRAKGADALSTRLRHPHAAQTTPGATVSASNDYPLEAAALDCGLLSRWTNWLSRKSAQSCDHAFHSWPPATTCTFCGSSAAAIIR